MEDIAMYRGKPGEIDILEYASVILKRKALISILTVSAFAVSLAVSLLLPKEYAATASVMPPQGQEDVVSAFLSSKLTGGIGSSDLWVGILNSQRVKDAIN